MVGFAGQPDSGHAVIIGGSVAGLSAAGAVAGHFDRVTVLERDLFPRERPDVRRSLPQSHHQHVLLKRGRDLLERRFPGFDAELAEFGAPLADYARDFVLVSEAGRIPRFRSGIDLRLCRRLHIDWVLRRRVAALPNVTLVDGVRVSRLLADSSRQRVVGVATASSQRGAQSSDSPGVAAEIRADLIVDATGRRSKAPQWLGALGYEAPEERIIDALMGYASRIYEPPAGWNEDWKAVEVASRPPHNPRSAGLWQVEGGRWLLTLIGTAGCYPPTDEAGFLQFARELADPTVHRAIRNARPVSAIRGYRGTGNRWRRYDRLARFPERLIVTGDGVCSLNPIYGQGMTVAALDAELLDELLGAARRRGRLELDGLARRFNKRVARVVSAAWLLSTAEDLRWPSTQGGEPDLQVRLGHRYMEQLLTLAPSSPEVVKAFLAVANMIKPPSALAHPRILGQLARATLRSRFAHVSKPTASRSLRSRAAGSSTT